MINKIKVLVVDDEPQIRKLLKLTLEANNFEVFLAENGKHGSYLAASINPELIILDLNLPDIDGLNLLKQIREWSKSQIIILSVRSSENDKISLLDAGADDFITKPFHSGELLARIRVALRHCEIFPDSPILKIGNFEINFSARSVRISDKLINFTSTEYEIFKLLIENADKVLTHKQILDSIWGNPFSEETQYIRVFIGQIRKKIEEQPSNPTYLKTVIGIGYIFQTK